MRRLALPAAVLLAPTLASAQYERPYAIAETFTAPVTSGPLYLDLISAPSVMGPVLAGDTVIVGVYRFDGRDLVGVNLARLVLADPFRGVTYAPAIALTPGATYAFAVFGSAAVTYDGGIILGGPAAGQAYACGPTIGCRPFDATPGVLPAHLREFGVVTGASPSAVVPEPTTLALTFGGLAALGAGVRRRRMA